MPHDFDTILGDGDDSRITVNDLPYTLLDVTEPGKAGSTMTPLVPFFAREDVMKEYNAMLKSLLEGPFNSVAFNAEVDAILRDTPVPQAKAEAIKAFMAARRVDILSKIEKPLTASSAAPVQSGYPRTTIGTIPLSGTFDGSAGDTVTVNGVAATLDARSGSWDLKGDGVTLTPGVNRVLVEEKDRAGAVRRRTVIDVWYDDGTVAAAPVAIGNDTVWTAAGGPYMVSGGLTVNEGVTLTIEPGTTVYMGAGAGFTVAGGGRLLAEGTAFRPIRFMSAPGMAALWGGMTINGTAASSTPETRIAFAHFQNNGGTALHARNGASISLSHITFGNTGKQYLSLDDSSFEVSDCVFPAATAEFEPVHGTGGIKAGGRGILRRNIHGAAIGYNDVIDFTGGSRPGPILQVYDSIFTGTGDDELDLDSTDAWVEGNVFLHAHKNGSPDSSSAVSGGSDQSDDSRHSEVTIVRNVFYDCDQAATAKQGNFYVMSNNTIALITKTGGLDTASGVINFTDDGTSAGAGVLLEGNIIARAEALVRNYSRTESLVTFSNNILPEAWDGPGTGNTVTASPPLDLEVAARVLSQAAVEADLSAQPWWDLLYTRYRNVFSTAGGVPERGGLAAAGIKTNGAPAAVTPSASVTLTFTPHGLVTTPTTAYEWGYTAYRWRLDGGAWSEEINSAVPLTLSALSAGPHALELSGRNDAGEFQATPTRLEWTVDPAFMPPVVINEVRISNGGGAGFIELANAGADAVDISGWSLSDDPLMPAGFVMPAGTIIPAGGFLLLTADAADDSPGLHTGFKLDARGGDLTLIKPAVSGGGVADSVSFGLQIPDASIGRTDQVWTLNRPTPGTANVAEFFTGPQAVRINEWVARGEIRFESDFVELYNSSPLPAALGGTLLSDNPLLPAKHSIRPLSFIAGNGFAVFEAEKLSAPVSDASKLTFGLDAQADWIVFSSPDGARLDSVELRDTLADVSAVREPDGSDAVFPLTLATPGLSNGAAPVTSLTSVTLLPLRSSNWRYDKTSASTPAGWQTTGGANWLNGAAPLGHDSDLSGADAFFFGTDFGSLAGSRKTYFFRADFPFRGDPEQVRLRFSYYLDDAAVIYLNGKEVHTAAFPRINFGGVPGSPVAFEADAASTAEIGVSAGRISPPAVSALVPAAGLLINGVNSVAVEVHQRGSSSSDIVMDLQIETVRSVTTVPPEPPEYERMRGLLDSLRVTEVMFDPAGGAEGEFIELRNLSPSASLDLTGVRFTKGIDFVFPAMTLAPGGYVCVARNPEVFRSLYGNIPVVAGPYAGKLSNSGDKLVLQLPDPWLTAIQIFTYQSWWYPAANGGGRSLEITGTPDSPRGWNDREGWRASAAPGGSPGGASSVPAGFAAWAASYGVVGAFSDSDGDGLTHFAEYALGLSPLEPDAGAVRQSAALQPDGSLVITFRLPAAPPTDVTFMLETSAGLAQGEWMAAAVRTAAGVWSGSAEIAETSSADGGLLVKAVIIPGRPRGFARLRFAIP